MLFKWLPWLSCQALKTVKSFTWFHMWVDEIFGASYRLLIKSNQVAWGNWTCYSAGALFWLFSLFSTLLLFCAFTCWSACGFGSKGLSWIFTPTPPQQHVRQTQTHSRLLWVWVCRGFKVVLKTDFWWGKESIIIYEGGPSTETDNVWEGEEAEMLWLSDAAWCINCTRASILHSQQVSRSC